MSDLIRRSDLIEACQKKRIEVSGVDSPFEVIRKQGKVFREAVDETPAVDAVPIDDALCDMLYRAVRFALTGGSFAVFDTVRYILPLIPKLSGKTLWCIKDELTQKPYLPPKSFGDAYDSQLWENLRDAISVEIKRRGENG